MDVRTVIANAMRTEFPEDADAILAALKEAGYVVIKADEMTTEGDELARLAAAQEQDQ